MKPKRSILALALILPALASCGNTSSSTSGSTSTPPNSSTTQADFYVRFRGEEVASGSNLEVSVNEQTIMLRAIDLTSTTGAAADVTYASSNADVLAVDAYTGLLTAKTAGTADITVTSDSASQVFHFTVSPTVTASGAISYATASYEDKAEILAALEDYAVDNYLTGITLFSNGGYIAYNDAFSTPAREYISGYGWGTMREASLTKDLTGNVTHKNYYNSAMTVLPTNSNAMDASGSDVSTIATYFTGSYYSNRMTSTNDSSEWYPSLALDLTDNTYPVAIDEETRQPIDSQYNKRWRIYVRCTENSSKGTVPVYRTGSSYTDGSFRAASYDQQEVRLEDYLVPFKFMLTGWNQQYRGAEQTEGVSGFAGAFSYYNATSNRPDDAEADAIYDEELWNRYMGDNIKTGTDENGAYIEFNFLNDCTPFYAMYYLSSSLYSPLPESFVRYWGGSTLGKNRNGATPVDTMLSVGPYYIDEWSSSLISLKKNEYFYEGTRGTDPATGNSYNEVTLNDGERRRLYQIPGFDFNQVSSTNTRSYFLDGMLHSYGLVKEDLASQGNFTTDTGRGNNGMTWTRRQTQGDSNFKINVNATTSEEWEAKFGPSGSVYAHDRNSTEYQQYHDRPKFLSDHDFLDFLSFGLDRKTICELRGMTPTQEYFSDNYLIDPESGVSYNSTDAHAAVLADRYNDGDNPGYNETAARDALLRAFQNTIIPNQNDYALSNPDRGWSADNPRVLTITMKWMNPTDVRDYDDVFDSWKRIFTSVSNTYYGGMYALEIETPTPSSDFNAVYDAMKRGEFDIGFGAISGEELMPLHFFEVLKSDNSSDFTLNWGPDTSEVSPDIVYDGKTWSFDALWQAGNSAALLNDQGALAAMRNVNHNTNSSDHSVTYTIDLSEFVNAGATNFAMNAATPSGNMESWSTDPSETEHLLTIDSNGRAQITLSDLLNYDSSESTSRDNATVSLTLNFEIMINGSRTSSTSTLSLQTYYGLTR